MHCAIFTDPLYHAEQSIEIDPADVIAIEERTISLFLRGKHQVTYVTLRNGVEHALRGFLKAQIEAAQKEAQSA